MVRLKAAEPQRIEELKRAFQFLMVRLKGRNGVNLNFFIAGNDLYLNNIIV